MRKTILVLLTLFSLTTFAQHAAAQIDARILRYADVSETQITFAYAGDVWVVPIEGGTANKLSSPEGQELFPKFSPDGTRIAFTGNYDGNNDIYVMPSTGGVPERLTHHGMTELMVNWHPDGQQILYASSAESGKQRFDQFYLQPVSGGLANKLPIQHASFGDISEDGRYVAFTTRSRMFRTWKRYRGGMAADIYVFDLRNQTSQKIAASPANDELPMWHEDELYFLSDRGEQQRLNLWAYNMESEDLRQVTNFSDFDIHFPSIGPNHIIFEAGGSLYLLDLDTEEYEEVEVDVVTDQSTLKPTTENVSNLIFNAWISPQGNRAVFEARGDIFSVPAEDGFISNLTRSQGVAERTPAYSPDGQYVAYWSDASGEYELVLRNLVEGTVETVTSYGEGFRYQPYWSPDSRKIAFVDKAMVIQIYDLDRERTVRVDKGLWMTHGALIGFKPSWSHDSKWLAYSRGLENRHGAIYLFDTEENERHQVTSGFYDDNQPVFDPDGKYLYYLTNRHFSPEYSDVDQSFIYPNTTGIAAVSLREDVPSPLAPENDTVAVKKDEDQGKKKKDENGDEEESEEEALEIDLENFESRAVLLPPEPGNYYNTAAAPGKVVYLRAPRTGSGESGNDIVYFDLEAREEQTVMEDVSGFVLSVDDKKLLVSKGNAFTIVDLAPGQSMEKPLRTSELEMVIDPRAEWRQIFMDAWRLQRDYFYDPNLHGVDWNAMRDRYSNLLEDAVTRWDVNFVLGELIGELNASHTYRGGGDTPDSDRRNVGYLGVDWEVNNGAYRIQRIIRGATWDVDVRSPLDRPGVDVNEGDYILAVNGAPLSIDEDPYAAFQGLAGKTVELTVNSRPNMRGARKVIVEPMSSETRLRNLAWIESNRQRVEQASDGRIGYVYVPNTSISGQNELVRMFTAQFNKDGMIIDERFNSGGQIPDRFIELLNRPPLVFWAVRDGHDWQDPTIAHYGTKAMLINGWSGSGGDAFPDYFKKRGLGPLIGERTWGGLIGISGVPRLVDGGMVTVPTFRMYNPDGTWFDEGYGVDPDIPVEQDPGQLSKGTDLQLERAIKEVMQGIENDFEKPDRPPYETR